MPGTFIIRPIEANLTHNTDFLKKMNPYCAVTVGNTRLKGQICKHGGKHPHWNDSITVPATNASKVLVEVMDKDRITHDDNVGSFVLDLNEVQASGQVSRWYPLTYKNKAAGEILLETVFQPSGSFSGGLTTGGVAGQSQYYQGQEQYGATTGLISGHNQYYEQEQLRTTQPAEVIEKEEIITKTTTTTQPTTTAVHEGVLATDTSSHGHVWTEQRQVVEPHTFVKEVEVVETRPALKEIEVMEPVKVLKDVQYTQAVPVRKQIEVVEPQVVTKEVEVIEPRLVTKTIQVVENVPVTRQVEVVEMRNAVQEVETVEPQTFTKQVEVTEYVPTRKQVEVTQPVTLKKAVEFVEPVITTQTITKEMQQPVIVNEEITTTVGPASVVGVSQEYAYGFQRFTGFEKLFLGLNEQERLFEQQRLSRLSEQEWLRERERLLALSEQQRLLEQRKFFGQYAGQYSGQQYTTSSRFSGFDRLFSGLNEKERLFEQQRLNRLSEQEWLREQQRLMALSEQERLLEQRRLFGEYQKTGGFTTYKKTTETVEQTTTSQGGLQQGLDLGQKMTQGHSSTYHASPNF